MMTSSTGKIEAADSRPGNPETADIETSSDRYALRFAGASGEWMLGIQEKLTLDLLRDMAPCSVLDVGGGHGQLARPLCKAGFDVTVLGSDESCRKRISDLVDEGKCRFKAGSVVELPFEDRSFDAVISFRLLTHCPRWPALVGELCRTARKRVVVDYPTSQSANAVAPMLFGAKKKMEGDTRTWTLFGHSEVEEAFRRNGYGVFGRKKQFFLPMVLHRALKNAGLSDSLETVCRSLGLTGLWGSPVILGMERKKEQE